MGARELLRDLAGAGFDITAEADRLVIRPWSKLSDDMREALRNAKPELMALLADKGGARAYCVDVAAVAWTDVGIDRFLDRRARLLRWGWTKVEAETLAERLMVRDREQDDRVSCGECSLHRPGRCSAHRAAGLHSPDLGRDLATLLQRCPGFTP